MFEVNTKILTSSTGSKIENLAIANGATVYSEIIPIKENVGFCVLTAVEDKSGGAGNVAITPEYSDDGTNFYENYSTSGGTATKDSAIISSLANTSRRITFTARLALFMRYKFVAAADSQITARHTHQEQY